MSEQLDNALSEYLRSKEVAMRLNAVSHELVGAVRDNIAVSFSAGWNAAVDAVASAHEEIFEGLSPQCGMARHVACEGTLLVVPDTRCACECHAE